MTGKPVGSPTVSNSEYIDAVNANQSLLHKFESAINPTLWPSSSHGHYWVKTKYGLLRAVFQAIEDAKPNADGIRILDVGSGTGSDLLMLRRILGSRGYSIDYYGVDASETRVAEAQENALLLGYGDIHFYVDNAETLEHTEGNFDIVTSSEVIEHVPRPEAMIGAIARKLKPGGHLVLTTPTVTRTFVMFYRYLFRRMERETRVMEDLSWDIVRGDPEKRGLGHISEMRVERMCQLLQENGLELVTLRRGFLTYGGYGWDRRPIMLALALLLDRCLDLYYIFASRIALLRPRTFSVNGIYHARNRATKQPRHGDR